MATSTKKQAVTTSRFRNLYSDQYKNELMSELELKNIHQVPKLEKIVINIGLGKSKEDKKMIDFPLILCLGKCGDEW